MPPEAAMLLAAGLGQRMRPLTEDTAKPLLPLGGRALMDHALDRLVAAGVKSVVVNTHWQAERVAAHLAARAGPPRLTLRHEEELLETGGGVRAALDVLGSAPFYVVNGDAFWLDGPRPALLRLADVFAPARMDAVLLLQRCYQVHADVGRGDFSLDPWGVPKRRGEREVVPYIFAGVQIVSAALLAGLAVGEKFSMNLAWDRALEAGRLRGLVHDGAWFHLSTPGDLADAETLLRAR
jgi:N-acetyl-alpha-D-muramate 1-phosphate uridylyltransferase